MKKIILFINVFLILFTASIYGQNQQQREQTRQELKERQQQEKDFNRAKGIEIEPINLSFFKLSKEDKRLIAPSETDRAKYANFLRLPDTEIVKIFSSPCRQIGSSDLSDNCKSGIPGFGNYYSFRHNRHLFGSLSDIQLSGNWFITIGFLTQGIIASLGDVDIEKLSLESDGVKFLANFVPAQTLEEADEQTKKIQNGIQNGIYSYSRTAEVKEGSVYAIRTIAYRSKVKTARFDKREDTIVVFKVINKDKDGNVTLIWRKLQSKEAPQIKLKK